LRQLPHCRAICVAVQDQRLSRLRLR
jgi:hypothetical protein